MQQMLEWTRKTFPMDLDAPRMIEDKIESLLKVEEEEHRKITSKAREEGWKEGKYGFSRW